MAEPRFASPDTLTWYEMPPVAVPGHEAPPIWTRMVAVDDIGRVYVPAIVSRLPEPLAMAEALRDGAGFLVNEDHVWLLAAWVRTRGPASAAVTDFIEKHVAAAHAEATGASKH